MESEKSSVTTRLHNVRFYNLAPRRIECLAYDKIHKKLALSRHDGTIEIWDMQYAPFHEKTIVTGEKSSIEGMAWAGNRLFTVGLTGHLVEWDLVGHKKLQTQNATGNSIWCVDVNKECTQLAVGTEEGYINIFDISEGQMVYSKLFDKQQGRILCCKFDATGEHLVTGGIDAIRIWDVKTGHALHKMGLTRHKLTKQVIVWSLQVLRDMTIISGDSRGIVTVWDGKNAAHLEEHYVLDADVLAVAVNDEETKFVCSGIDPRLRIYALTAIKKEDITLHKWVKYRQRKVHDHDVKALVCVGDMVVSGGVDGYMGFSPATRMKGFSIQYGPFLQRPSACVASNKRLLLLRYPNTVEIWKLGETDGRPTEVIDEEEGERNLLAITMAPAKLLEMQSKHASPITCSTLSPDGNWLIYSTTTHIRMFYFVEGDDEKMSQLMRVKGLPRQFTPCKNILFSHNSGDLFLSKVDNSIEVFEVLANGEVDHCQKIDASKHIKDTIHRMAITYCGNYLIAAGTCRTIAVWIRKGKHFKHHLNLPRYTAVATAISTHQHAPRLVAAFSDSKIVEYDLEEMCFTCTEKEFFSKEWEVRCVNNIVLDARNPDVFIVHDDENLFVLEKVSPEDKELGAAKKQRTSESNKVDGLQMKFNKKCTHFIHLDWLEGDELVAVGVNPISLIEQLPKAFATRKFGAQ